MFTPISFDYFWFKVHFVRYFNGYISLFIRHICLECFCNSLSWAIIYPPCWDVFIGCNWRIDPLFTVILLVCIFFLWALRPMIIEQWLLISICCSFAIGDSVVCVCVCAATLTAHSLMRIQWSQQTRTLSEGVRKKRYTLLKISFWLFFNSMFLFFFYTWKHV